MVRLNADQPATPGRPERLIRLAWWLIAALLALDLWGASIGWFVIGYFPWAIGAALLFTRRWGHQAVAVWRSVWRTGGVPQSSLWWSVLILLLAIVFSPTAAVLALTWAGALLILLGSFASQRFLKELVVGSTIGSVALCATLATAEAIFRLPVLQQRFGLPQEVAAWSTRYDRAETTNILGFRSEHENVHRDSAALRVLALGDSFTWGDKIAMSDSTWPSLLESLLQEWAPSVEVFNLGRNGFTMANEAELLSRIGWQLCPDLVVVQYYLNDVLPSGPDFAHQGAASLVQPWRLIPTRLRSGRISSSAFLAFLERQVNLLWVSPRQHRKLMELYRSDSQGWRQFQRAMSYLSSSADLREVPILLVLYPRMIPGRWTEDSYPLADVYGRVARLATELGLEVLDLTGAFAARGEDWRHWRATPYDAHPGPQANVVAASAIAERIRERKLLGKDTGGERESRTSGPRNRPLCQPLDPRPFQL